MKKLFQLVGYITIDGLQKAEKNISDFEKKVRKAVRPIDRFGKQVAGIGKTFTANFTAPLAIAGGAAVKFGADFQKAMTNSLAIMGADAEQMRSQMEDVARDVAKTSTFSATQAAEAYYFLASAGMDAAQSMEALPKVAKFAQAGNFDLARATDLLTDAQSALGLSSDDTAESILNMRRVSDVLVKANTIANASVEQFSESLTNRAGAALRMLEKDVEEGAAVLAVFADQGIKGAEAGTRLDIVLRDLQKASINNKEAFKEANITVFDASGNMRNMADIVQDLEDRFEGMSDEQRRSELMMLGFTDKSVAATTSLLGTSDAIRKYEADLRIAGGTTEEVANKQLESLSAKFEILKSKLVDVAIEFSKVLIPLLEKTLIPIVEDVISKIDDLVKWFTDLPDSMQKTIIGITTMVAVTGPLLIIFGKLLSSVTLITTAIKAAKLAMIAFNATMLANPFGVAVLGIAAVTGAIIGLRHEYKKLSEAHRKWSVQTTDQAERQKFIDGVSQVIEKIKEQGDAIQTEAQLEKALGKEIENLTAKAREMGYVIEGNTSAKLQAINTISQEIQGVRDSTGALVKYKNETKEVTEVIKKQSEVKIENIELSKAEIEAKEREAEAAKKAAEDKRNAEIDYLTQARIAYADFTGDVIASIELRREVDLEYAENALSKEQELIEAKRMINAQYDAERKAAVQTRENEIAAIKKAGFEMQKVLNSQEVQMAIEAFNQITQLTNMATENKIAAIEQEFEKEKEAILLSEKNEEEKQAAIQKLEIETDKKKRKLMREQAKRDKAAAIFAAIVNTAQAVSKALTLIPPLNFIMAAITGALGAVQIGLIAAQPLPRLAEGGVVPQTVGGRQVIAGEGNDDEIIMPMRKGTQEIAAGILNKVGNALLPADLVNSRALLATPGGSNKGLRPIQHVWNIGTLVADDAGIKELERRQLAFRVSEAQRKGGD